MNIEGVGSSFELDKFLIAREKTIEAVQNIAKNVFLGMNESDGQKLIDEILQDMGSEKLWHPNKFRIGKETLKAFREKPDQSITLQKNDIFFIDIGPVWDGYEGDYGETFVFGNDNEFQKLKDDSYEIFKQTEKAWKEESLSGIELYQRAKEIAENLGHTLNTAMNGHRLSEFPHALYHKGSLIDFEKRPQPNLWVLEILISNKSLGLGAFFEDLIQE